MDGFKKELEAFLCGKVNKEINEDRIDAYRVVQWFAMDYELRRTEGGDSRCSRG